MESFGAQITGLLACIEGYETLVAGLAIFVIGHLLISLYAVHSRLVAMLGKNMLRLVHSGLAVVGLVLMVMGYSDRPIEILWALPPAAMMAPVVVMPFALILLAGSGVSRPSIQRITRHPMLWGVFLWAAAHLVANGDKGSVMLFGSMLFYSLAAQWLGDRKMRRTDPQGWAALRHRTSAIPLLALFSGRTTAGSPDKGLLAVAIGLVMYGALLYLHPYVSGVAIR
ncbi:MAG: NnrU family protein [Proteobacteria bacterium]|nr:NnrU family protein [Pseudomonadota bacterium]